ncbi:MAG: hypothetical protein PVI40_05410 [Chlamydiota bacterium]|jgi:hypothetical protein
MKPSSIIVLKTLLNKATNSKKLLEFLPDNEKKEILDLDQTAFFSVDDFNIERILNNVHYSWLYATLFSLEDSSDAHILMSALSFSIQDKLKKALEISHKPVELSQFAKHYCLLVFLGSLLGEADTLLPKNYLPFSEMNILLELSKVELIKLIDFLALFDVAVDLKKMVDTKSIKLINSSLSSEQKQFLKKISSYQEPYSFAPLLSEWDKTEEQFHKILHKRGLNRLGFALCLSHPDLIWYITHFLDSGRGNSLIKFSEKKISAKVVHHIRAQVLEIINFIRKSR